ncbi:MBL fold metallo-hydrolase [Portibacter marinus]|uniref:MBL fold metallo-hydrolase n=1 Tax=Portibacter marinus TaxID=2898660 RepID=UPI001F1E4AC7|nr:MBL fold metallo-hydrolase [Portibacter marinus]
MLKCLILSLSLSILTIFSLSGQNLEVVVLGIAQDAGYPQINCDKECCIAARKVTASPTYVSSLGIVDLNTNEYFLIDCTPDFKDQLHMMSSYSRQRNQLPKGILLTHAHIGHYLGLAQLGKEAMNANQMPVYAMPKMAKFIKNNGPWEQLVKLNNIDLKPLKDGQKINLTENLAVTPMRVPHRDEYSETVGFLIEGKEESLLYIPDIDKWEKWEHDIKALIQDVDHALIDATFYDGDELPNRKMSEIPHPFVEESMKKFADLSPLNKAKIQFIHFNHTNPLLNNKSKAYKTVFVNGYNVASQGLSIYLD